MSKQVSGLTLVLGERRSGKMHKALEMAKGHGRLVCLIVPHLEVRARRAEMASKGVMVFSDRNVGMQKRRDLAFVIDRASALVISRFLAPDVPVYATTYRPRSDALVQQLEAAGARVIDLASTIEGNQAMDSRACVHSGDLMLNHTRQQFGSGR